MQELSGHRIASRLLDDRSAPPPPPSPACGGGGPPRQRQPVGLKAAGRSLDDQSEEIAPSHSMTSSARASKTGGTVRPSAFAAVRLIISSNRVGCPTGRSAGLAPLIILSTQAAAYRSI